jgi:hypothetical protein
MSSSNSSLNYETKREGGEISWAYMFYIFFLLSI